ncbi:APC family permease [Halorubellus sp. PRR65]|uniref:APC family permease n=1 Tax=Halorubellus sp. PRR65 TaxID=3098148 RepID=UPI002B263363|nr:APC family permease [Halorubellus sp. PRR65]
MAQHEGRSPSASLGLLDATMVGMGAMIGAGIFVLTGLAADIAGPAAILVFGLNGVVTSFTALSYAELASAIPKSGGGYAFVEEVFRDSVAFQMGWMLWFAYMIAGALYALGFAGNFLEFVHFYWEGLPSGALLGPVTWKVLYAICLVGGLVVLNAVSTAASGGAETVVTIVKIVILVVFSAYGANAVDLSEFEPFFTNGTVNAILPAMGLTFIAFEGYDLIATVTEEVENPRKNIPRAIFLSLAATIVIYLVVVLVAIGTLGAGGLASAGERGIAEAAKGFMPAAIPILQNGASVVAFGAVFSTVSALNAVVLASSRVAFAMGRDRLLPAQIGRIHHRFGTPLIAVVASAAVMLVSVTFVPIRQVGSLSSLFFLLSFVVVNASVIKLRRERPDMRRPYEMPFYPAPAVAGIVGNLVLGYYLVTANVATAGLAFGWLVLGGIAYVALGRLGLRREPAGGASEGIDVDVAGTAGAGGGADAASAVDGAAVDATTSGEATAHRSLDHVDADAELATRDAAGYEDVDTEVSLGSDGTGTDPEREGDGGSRGER